MQIFVFDIHFHFDILHSSWHTFVVHNPTLTGALLENPTLCGTEIGQNSTLAILTYVYCHQWEYPLGLRAIWLL